MKAGYKLKVIEIEGKKKRKTTKEGEIIFITNGVITILEEKHGNKFRESFTPGDLLTKEKRFFVSICDEWQEIIFNQEGGKIIYKKVVRKCLDR